MNGDRNLIEEASLVGSFDVGNDLGITPTTDLLYRQGFLAAVQAMHDALVSELPVKVAKALRQLKNDTALYVIRGVLGLDDAGSESGPPKIAMPRPSAKRHQATVD